MQNNGMSGRDWTTLLVLSLLWGGSFFFLAIALRELPPITIMLLRVSLGALPLLANRALFGLAGATLAALAIAGLILLLFGASLSFRIRRLRNAARRFATQRPAARR